MSADNETKQATESVTEILSTLALERDADGNLSQRFEALWRRTTTGYALGNTYTYKVEEIDASLGAIVRAAAACGLAVLDAYLDSGVWGWRFYVWETSEPLLPQEGATPEEAAAKALIAAVEPAHDA